jgi:cysteine desulfurase
VLTGHATDRLWNNASFCFRGIAGEAVLVALADHGIACSSGSACAAGETDPSHVLTAMGIPGELAHTAVRFTLGQSTTADHIDTVVDILSTIVAEIRGGVSVPGEF